MALKIVLQIFLEISFEVGDEIKITEGNIPGKGFQVVAGKLAYVMTGGELSRPTWVNEEYVLDLEREAFLSLCGEEKTQQRMWNLLQTGKPLRN